MPGPLVHFYIGELLAKSQELSSIVKLNTVEEKNALLLGTIAPDIGSFPGGNAIISDLSHYYLTGDLVKNILSSAKCNLTTNFAIGWLSHYFADIEIHKLINYAVGELLYNDRSIAVDYDETPQDHFRIEFGLDGLMFYQLNLPQPEFIMPGSAILDANFLPSAFEQTYKKEFKIEDFEVCFRSSTKYSKIISEISVAHASRFLNGKLPTWCLPVYFKQYLPARLLSLALGRRFPHYGLGAVVKPQAWLVTETIGAINVVVQKTIYCILNKQTVLENIDLVTGYAENHDSKTVLRVKEQLNS